MARDRSAALLLVRAVGPGSRTRCAEHNRHGLALPLLSSPFPATNQPREPL